MNCSERHDPLKNNLDNILTLYYFSRENSFDTAIMNPPFGTKNNEGIDMEFLDRALCLCRGAVYSFHKTSTRDFITRRMEGKGYHVAVLAEMKFSIPQMYKMHRQREVLVAVDFIRVSRDPS